MTATWKKVRLGEVLRHRKEFIAIDDLETYRRPRVQLHAKGIVLRDEVPGALIKTKKQQVCSAGELLVAEIDAKVGGFGMVPEALDGALVSSHYFLFVVDSAKLDGRFLDYFIRTPVFREQVEAQGSTNYAAIRPAHVLGYEIPLPPLAEQRRIVARIDELATYINETRGLQQAVRDDLDSLSRGVLLCGDAKMTPMGELVSLRQPDVKVAPDQTYKFAGVYSFGRGMFRAQERAGMEFSYAQLTMLRSGDFTYPKLMAWEGAFAVVPEECDGYVVSTEFPVFEVNRDKVLPEVLDVYFRSRAVWGAISGASTGTNVRRRRLNPKDFLDLQIPLPSLRVQSTLRQVMNQAAILRRHQDKTDAELDALLPSILNRAFSGYL